MNEPPPEPPRAHQLRVISEADVWLRNAVSISADMIMIEEIKIALRRQLWELKGLPRGYSTRERASTSAGTAGRREHPCA